MCGPSTVTPWLAHALLAPAFGLLPVLFHLPRAASLCATTRLLRLKHKLLVTEYPQGLAPSLTSPPNSGAQIVPASFSSALPHLVPVCDCAQDTTLPPLFPAWDLTELLLSRRYLSIPSPEGGPALPLSHPLSSP